MWLAKVELEDVVNIAKWVPPGRHRLRDMFGDGWEIVLRKSHVGKLFKQWVKGGWIPKVTLAGKRSDRSLVYEVSTQ